MILLTTLLTLPILEATPEPERGTRFGRAVLSLGDVDGDGHRDFAVGAPAAANRAGRVLVISGKDRSVLQRWSGERGRRVFGHSLRSAGDVDGDGHDDVLVGHEHGARTEVRSGATGALIGAFDCESSQLHAFGDLDRDDRNDLLLTGADRWEIRSGLDGSIVGGPMWIRDEGPFHPVGDVNGDGLTDGLLFGKKDVYICQSTRTGKGGRNPLHYEQQVPLTKRWPNVFDTVDDKLFLYARSGGDLDGDSKPDLLVFWTPRGEFRLGEKRPIHAVGMSLRSQEAVWSVSRDWIGFAGTSVAFGYTGLALGDFDGDGASELVIADSVVPMSVSLEGYSSSSDEPAWRAVHPDVGSISGLSLSSYGDVDDDGALDFLMGKGDRFEDGNDGNKGAVSLVSGRTGELIWTLKESDVRAELEPTREDK